MVRVALGCARTHTEGSGKHSGWEFSSNPRGRAQASATGRSRSQVTGGSFGTNTILTVPRSNFEREVDIDLEVGDASGDMDAATAR
jgi:hypothetical protein